MDGVAVVKAFNTLSAYEFENNIAAGGRELPVAGAKKWAKDAVGKIIQKISADADGGPRSRVRTAGHSAQPPIDVSGNFSAHVSAE